MFPLRAILQEDNYPLNSAKGRLCNNIDFKYDRIEDEKTYSTRPKLIIVTFLSFFSIAIAFFFISSHNYSKKVKIIKRRQGVMTLKQHVSYLSLIMIAVFLDQIFNLFMEHWTILDNRTWMIEQGFILMIVNVFSLTNSLCIAGG